MNKFCLSDLSVTFSVKIDSGDRLNNLRRNLEYYSTFFEQYEVIIVEQGEVSIVNQVLTGDRGIHHYFIPSNHAHYKTRNLNYASSFASREFIMMCDCDVLCTPECLIEAVKRMRQGVSFLSPYNGVAVEMRKEFFLQETHMDQLINQLTFFPKDFNLRQKNFDYSKMFPLYGSSHYDNTGGCLLYRKRDFYLTGGWNTNFISYGYEDMEFIHRVKTLGYTLHRLDKYNIYHFEHERKADSMYNNFYQSNLTEWKNVYKMSPKELGEYSLNGFRKIILSNKREINIINTADEYSIQVKDIMKIPLDDLSIILPINIQDPRRLYDLNLFVFYLDLYFKNYEVIKVEAEHRKAKYLPYQKNTQYVWSPEQFNRATAIKRGLEKSGNPYVAVWDFLSLINPNQIQRSMKSLRKSGKRRMLTDNNWNLPGLSKRQHGAGVTLFKR